VLSTAPSLRSDSPPSFDFVQRRCAGEAQELGRAEKHHDGTPIDFPILLAVSIPAAVIMAFILTNVVIGWFKKI
jgi:hypothetical protein